MTTMALGRLKRLEFQEYALAIVVALFVVDPALLGRRHHAAPARLSEASRKGMGSRSRASDPKVDSHFWDRSDARFLKQRIVLRGKPGPLFRTMR